MTWRSPAVLGLPTGPQAPSHLHRQMAGAVEWGTARTEPQGWISG